MRIDVLSIMVVLALRYLYSIKRYLQKKTVVYRYLPIQLIFKLLALQKNPKYQPRGTHFAQGRELRGVSPTHQICCF